MHHIVTVVNMKMYIFARTDIRQIEKKFKF